MADNTETVDSIESFVYEEETISSVKGPRRVEITVEPEGSEVSVGTVLTGSESKSEIPFVSLAIQEALDFDLKNASDEETLANNVQLRYLLCRTTELLKGRTELCHNLEKQIKTLELETTSLKELLTVTKDLLNVRNLEVLTLHDSIKDFEESISREKEKHRSILSNMNETVKVITKMKEEHRKQMELTTELHEGYKKKIELLEKENKLLASQLCEERNTHPTTEKSGDGDTRIPEEKTIAN